MSTRRRSGAELSESSPVDDATDRKGMVEIFMERHKHNLELFAPLVGAAVGAVALEAASQHVAMKKHEIALVGAGIAFLMGANVKGPARQLAMGAAAGAACYGVVDLLREGYAAWLYKGPKVEATQSATAPPDAITRADFDRVLAEMRQRHQAELADTKRAHESQIAEMQGMVRSLLDELRGQRAAKTRQAGAAATSREAANTRTSVEARESSTPPASGSGLPPARGDEQPANENRSSVGGVSASKAAVGPAQAAHFGAIYSLLTAEERIRVSSMIARASATTLATVQGELLAMTPARAVAHLRRNVFPSMGSTA